MTDIDMQSFSGDTESAAAAQPAAISEDYEANLALVNAMDDVQQQPQVPQAQEVPEIKEEPVSRDHFRALTETVDKLKAERESERLEFKQQLELLRANVDRSRDVPKPQSIFEQMGLSKTDVPTVDEIEKAWQSRESQYLAKIEELEVASTRPDYTDVLSKHTAEVLKQKPHLAQGILSAQNKALAAYELGQMHRELQELKNKPSTTPTVNPQAQRIVDNANKPRTLSQSGGTGALSHADYFANLSDQEFLKLAAKNMGEV